MKQDFVLFEKFNSEKAAVALGTILGNNEIEYLIENISIKLDPILSNNEFGKEYCIKIKQDDFENANSILQQQAKEEITNLQADYPVLHFSDDELLDIIEKSDEWNKFDVELARKLLGERGKGISTEELKEIKNKRIAELSKPEGSQQTYIIIGYITAFLGGLLGIFIGWHILTFKKTLPNGTQVYAYSANDRKQGNRIAKIGVLFLIIWILVRVLTLES